MPTQHDPQKHHRRSIRLPGYDYTQPGAYFITITTHQHIHLFGEIVDEEMHLNYMGQIAKEEWSLLPSRFPSLTCGLFVVMPNHIHGVLVIADSESPVQDGPENRSSSDSVQNLSYPGDIGTSEQFGRPVNGSIPTIVRSYKSSVTNRIHLLREHPNHPIWHRNYYEHIVRSTESMERIEDYILGNPSRWDEDHFNKHRTRRYGHGGESKGS